MTTITLQEAYDLLERAKAMVIANDSFHPIVNSTLHQLTGEPENMFLYLDWVIDDGYDNKMFEEFMFEEKNNQTVEIEDSIMYLTNTEGNLVHLDVLVQFSMEKLVGLRKLGELFDKGNQTEL